MAADDMDTTGLPAEGPGLLTAIRRHPIIVFAALLVAATLGILATSVLPTTYTAQARIVLGDENDATVFRSEPILNATAKAQNAAQVMRSQEVYERASEILEGRLSPSEVKNQVSVTPGEEGSPLVTITATAESDVLARDLANAEGQAYLDVVQQQSQERQERAVAALTRPKNQMQARLQRINKALAERVAAVQKRAEQQIESPGERARFVQVTLSASQEYQDLRNQAANLLASIGEIDQQLQETRIDNSLMAAGVDTLFEASTPLEPTSPNLVRNVGIALVLGLLLGAGLAWRRLEGERAVEPAQAAAALRAPLLASVGHDRELRDPTRVVDLTPGRRLADDLSGLASSLMLHVRRRSLDGVVITSVSAGEGKTVLALNLAAAARATGHDVMLVDADIRNHELTDAVGRDGSPGLMDLLSGESNRRDVLSAIPIGDSQSLPVMPVGTLTETAASELRLPDLQSARADGPVLVVDSPSVTESPVAVQLGAGSAGLVIVVSNATTADDLRALRARADLAGAPIVGFVMNDHKPRRRRKRSATPSGQRRRSKAPATSLAAEPAMVPGE